MARGAPFGRRPLEGRYFLPAQITTCERVWVQCLIHNCDIELLVLLSLHLSIATLRTRLPCSAEDHCQTLGTPSHVLSERNIV